MKKKAVEKQTERTKLLVNFEKKMARIVFPQTSTREAVEQLKRLSVNSGTKTDRMDAMTYAILEREMEKKRSIEVQSLM